MEIVSNVRTFVTLSFVTFISNVCGCITLSMCLFAITPKLLNRSFSFLDKVQLKTEVIKCWERPTLLIWIQKKIIFKGIFNYIGFLNDIIPKMWISMYLFVLVEPLQMKK